MSSIFQYIFSSIGVFIDTVALLIVAAIVTHYTYAFLRRKKKVWILFLVLAIIGAAYLGSNGYNLYKSKQQAQGSSVAGSTPVNNTCHDLQSVDSKTGIGGSFLPDNEYVGVSDGTLAFDLTDPIRHDMTYSDIMSLKCQGVQKFSQCAKSHLPSNACQLSPCSMSSSPGKFCADGAGLLTQEINTVPNDAESLIYRQNIHIWEKGSRYFTLIVGISLGVSEPDLLRSRYLLQGVYTAQEEYNRNPTNPESLRILIANFGNCKTSGPETVFEQVKQAVAFDPTIVGMVNMPCVDSPGLGSELQQFSALPIVFPSGAVGSSNDHYKTMFHIAPPAWQEGNAGALLARAHNIKNVVVFVDPDDPYSRNLACSFLQQFQQNETSNGTCDGNRLDQLCQTGSDICRTYTSGESNILKSKLNINSDTGLLYFTGKAPDALTLLKQLNQQNTTLSVMGSNRLYQQIYPSTDYKHLEFTAYAYADELQSLNIQKFGPSFVDEFALDFQGWPPSGQVYGTIRPDSTQIMSYDATNLLVRTFRDPSNQGQIPAVSRMAVLQNVQNVPFQGISGYTHFDSDGNPLQKATLLLFVNSNGQTKYRHLFREERQLATNM